MKLRICHLRAILFKSILLSLLLSPNVWSASLKELSEGKPNSFKLPDEVFTEVKTLRLKNARVLWFNFELAKEMGINIPKEGLTPEFEKQVLDAFAYNVPHENAGLENFTKIEKYAHCWNCRRYRVGQNYSC